LTRDFLKKYISFAKA